VAALQQLNYDLTMQLELYQQMVGRLKDRMEQVGPGEPTRLFPMTSL
jgi:hypothetical protein